MKNLSVVAVFILFIFLTAAEPPTTLTDWSKAYEQAKAGKTVRLVVIEVVSPSSESFNVYIQDGDKKHRVASSAVYPAGLKKASYAYDIKSDLIAFGKPPSNDAKIVIEETDGTKVAFLKAEVTLPAK